MLTNAKEVRVCIYCNHLNEPYQDTCEKCGQLLPLSTVQVNNDVRNLESITIPDIQASPGKVILYIPGYPTPYTLTVKKVMSIGRSQPSDPIDVDLTPFNAHLLGVSRLHAQLHFNADATYLEDLDSSNGSWVNENKIASRKRHPVQSGDTLRFGNFLAFIYFSENHAAQITFRLREIGTPSGQPRQGIHINYLKYSLVPFLEMLTQLQLTLNKALGNAVSEVSVAGITLSEDKKGVMAVMNGAVEAVQYTAVALMPVKQGLKNRLLTPQGSEANYTQIINGESGKEPETTNPTSEELTPEVMEELYPLAENFLKKYNGSLDYAEQIIPYLHQMILGNLELTIE